MQLRNTTSASLRVQRRRPLRVLLLRRPPAAVTNSKSRGKNKHVQIRVLGVQDCCPPHIFTPRCFGHLVASTHSLISACRPASMKVNTAHVSLCNSGAEEQKRCLLVLIRWTSRLE